MKNNVKSKGFRKGQILEKKLLKRMIHDGADEDDLAYYEDEE